MVSRGKAVRQLFALHAALGTNKIAKFEVDIYGSAFAAWTKDIDN